MKLVACLRAVTRPDEAGPGAGRCRRARAGRSPNASGPRAARAARSTRRRQGRAARRRAAQGRVAALAIDARCPTDKDRTVAHTFAIGEASVTFTPRFGDSTVFEWNDVTAILRGVRASRIEVQRTEKTKSFSVGTAVVTGGLKTTRTATKTVRSSEEEIEQVISSMRAMGVPRPSPKGNSIRAGVRECSPPAPGTCSSSPGGCARRRRARSTTSGCSGWAAGRCRSCRPSNRARRRLRRRRPAPIEQRARHPRRGDAGHCRGAAPREDAEVVAL